MISLSAKLRAEKGKKTKTLKNAGQVPAVVYGPGVKNASIAIDEKEFAKVLKKAGESSLVELDINGEKTKRPVLIHDIQKDPVSGKIIHVDFYQADLTKEVEVKVPLVFEGVALAEKELGGTLNKNMLEIEVKATPEKLPHEIIVSIEGLKTFADHILVKNIKLPQGVTTPKNPDEVVAAVLPPQKIEEELAEEITEDVESIEKVEKPAKEEEPVQTAPEEPEKDEAK